MTKKQQGQLMEECLRLKEARDQAYIEGVKHNVDREYLKKVDAFIKGDSNALKIEDIHKVRDFKELILKQIGA